MQHAGLDGASSLRAQPSASAAVIPSQAWAAASIRSMTLPRCWRSMSRIRVPARRRSLAVTYAQVIPAISRIAKGVADVVSDAGLAYAGPYLSLR